MIPDSVDFYPNSSSDIRLEIHHLPDDRTYYKVIGGFAFLEFDQDQFKELYRVLTRYKLSQRPYSFLKWLRPIAAFVIGFLIGDILI